MEGRTESREFAAETLVKFTALQPLRRTARRPALPTAAARQEMRQISTVMDVLGARGEVVQEFTRNYMAIPLPRRAGIDVSIRCME
jgi:hypothetical protein